MKPFRLFASLAIGAAFALPGSGAALAEMQMRISLDTGPTHQRNICTQKFADIIKEKTKGEIVPTIFPSGQLFPDGQVGRALRQGGADMAVPSIQVTAGFEPNLDILNLPMFFGRSQEDNYKVIDGEVGAKLNASVEEKLGSKVIGKWLDVGAWRYYTTKTPLNSPRDLKGLKIRFAGGWGTELRTKFFGATPGILPFPDVPLALSQGTYDGIASTDGSLVSAKLWEAGLKYGSSEIQGVGEYMPLVSKLFWDKLKPEQQKLMVDTWGSIIDDCRKFSDQAQQDARKILIQNGMTFNTPDPATLTAIRKEMMATEEELVKSQKLDPVLVELSRRALGN